MKTSRQTAQEFIDEQCPHLQSLLELLTQFATRVREKTHADAVAEERKLNQNVLGILLGDTPGAAMNAVREDYPELAKLVDAHDERVVAAEQERTAKFVTAVRRFRESAGKHDGEHDSALTGCSRCNESYVAAEAELDAAILAQGTPAPSPALSKRDLMSTPLDAGLVMLEMDEKKKLESAIKAANELGNMLSRMPAAPAKEPER